MSSRTRGGKGREDKSWWQTELKKGKVIIQKGKATPPSHLYYKSTSWNNRGKRGSVCPSQFCSEDQEDIEQRGSVLTAHRDKKKGI